MFLLSHRAIKSVIFCTICLLSLGNIFVWAAVPATHLDFPAIPIVPGIPGVPLTAPGAAGAPQLFEHFIVQDVSAPPAVVGNIYFPTDGRQPTTPEAAQWSCANVDANNLASPITQWYINAFFKQNFGFTGKNSITSIIKAIAMALHPGLDNAFREIAANPVGRVLLYRLIIEIRRQDATNEGCVEDGIEITPDMSNFRRWIRKISIRHEVNKFEFEPIMGNGGSVIRFDPAKIAEFACLRINAVAAPPTIDTVELQVGQDVALFHEMLHWFQFLRHPKRFTEEDIEECDSTKYMYLGRCYYGDMSEYFTWGGLDHQEMRTILGAPNYNTAAEVGLFHANALLPADPGSGIAVGTRFLPSNCLFYNGDDLSENAYRMAKHAAANPVRMRFGHGGIIEPIDITDPTGGGGIVIPNRFQLAHLVATNCCNAIVTANGGPPINNWNLISGEAAQ
jgi:hypothetical protein